MCWHMATYARTLSFNPKSLCLLEGCFSNLQAERTKWVKHTQPRTAQKNISTWKKKVGKSLETLAQFFQIEVEGKEEK